MGRTMLRTAASVLVVLLAGCGGGTEKATCSPVVVEQIDPNQGHLIAGAPEPTYLTWPPTSGPHIAGLLRTGVLDEPLSGLEQVSTLETGAVIIQYRPSVSPADTDALRRLASGTVAVAPGRDLPAEVVATGWLRKMSCTDVDQDALRVFIAAVTGQHQGHTSASTATSVTGG